MSPRRSFVGELPPYTSSPRRPSTSPAENAHHPLGPGWCSPASSSLAHAPVSVSSANASAENLPAPRCPRSLGSTSPPNTTTCFPIPAAQNTLRGDGLSPPPPPPVVSTVDHAPVPGS
ncbi:Os09g0249100 [Oryza sativa Japonica Group]|uniref:Os09g0249100 protein n=1 Tax=Oryza sativa subsp. japonica TaxID=39947 RepID=Q0J380_ORYSJ|nr:Os09g0249100 [Oryza sativa Japonica Group]|eukprot:NP_001062671.1 Os09g0249100 [Oryza sativa Japonica Group]